MNKPSFEKSAFSLRNLLLFLLALGFFFAGNAHAQTVLIWDPQGAKTGTGSDNPPATTETWDLTTANWYNGTTDVAWANGVPITMSNGAVIGAGGPGGNITVAVPIDVGGSGSFGLTFDSVGYNLSGSALTIGAIYLNAAASGTTTINDAVTITNNGSGTFGAPGIDFVTANQTLILAGGGQLNQSNGGGINGTGASTATLDLNGGTFTLGSSGQWFSIGNAGTVGSSSGLVGGIVVNTGATFVASASTSIGEGASGMFTVNGGTVTETGGFLAAGRSLTGTEVSRIVLNSGSMSLVSAQVGLSNTLTSNTVGGGEFDVNGGTLSITYSLTLNSASTVGQALLNVTGGTSTIYQIAIGGNATGGVSTIDLSGGTLYIGSGGIYNLGLGTSTNATNLSGGTLAASGAWTSALNMNLTNNVTIQAANASNVGLNIGLSGNLSGTGGFVKTGGGTLTLSGTNTYAGTTVLNAGTLEFTNEASLYNDVTTNWTGSNITVASGTTLAFGVGGAGQFSSSDITLLSALSGFQNNSSIGLDTTAGNFTFSGAISNANTIGLTKLGVNTLTLTGANTYIGPTTVLAGTLDLGGGGATGSISSSSTLTMGGGTFNYTVNTGGTQTFSGLSLIAGASSVNTVAGDTLALGAITQSPGGSVNFGNIGTITTTNVNDPSGILGGYATINGTDWAANNGAGVIIAFSNYTETNIAGTTAANYAGKNVDVNNSAGTLTGAISASTLRFNTNAADTVSLTGSPNILSDGAILVTPTVGAATSTITGGTLEGSASGNLVIDQNNASGGLTISSIIANNGSATGLIKNGTGMLTLSGVNTYSGANFLNAGVTSITSTNALGTGMISFDGGSLQYHGSTTDYSNNIVNSTGVIAIDVDDTTVTWAGNLAASNTNGLTVMDTGAGTTGILILGGANQYTGATNILSGSLRITNVNSLGYTSSVTVASGATLQTSINNTFINTPNLLLNGSGVGGVGALDNSSNATTYNGLITLGSNTTIGAASGSLTLTDTGTSITGSGFNLTLVGAGNITIGDAIATGTGALTINATGTDTLSATNTYTGLTSVNSGTLKMGSTTALNANNVVSVATGATFDLNGNTQTIAGLNTASGGGIITNSATNSTKNLTLAGSGTYTFGGVINPGGSGSITGLTMQGTGMQTLTGTNTYTGVTSINAGILSVGTINNGGVAGNLGAATNVAANLVLGGGDLQYTGATASTDRSFTLTNGKTSDIEVTSAATTLTMTGADTSGGALTKLGAGTLLLTGTNAATGLVTVTAGTLQVGNGTSGSIASASSVGASGTLAFNLASGGSYGLNIATTAGGSVVGLTTATNTLGGVISGGGGLTQSGTGTTILSGVDTYTGTTTVNAGTLQVYNGTTGSIAATSSVVINGGTLVFGKSNSVGSATTAVTLAGGTLAESRVAGLASTAGLTNTTGVLTLTGASTIDFGATAGEHNTEKFTTFSDSSNSLLTINDWEGGMNLATDSGSNDQIIFTNNPSAALLNDIQFNISGTDYTATSIMFGGSAFEIVPGAAVAVPEPGTIVVGLLFLGLLARGNHKRINSLIWTAIQ